MVGNGGGLIGWREKLGHHDKDKFIYLEAKLDAVTSGDDKLKSSQYNVKIKELKVNF
jgi:hypothetical protein